MSTNNSTNRLIQLLVILSDFILLNAVILVTTKWYMPDINWDKTNLTIFLLINNTALLISQMFFSTIIHQRIIGAGDILRRVMSLTFLQVILSYILLRTVDFPIAIGWPELFVGTIFVYLLIVMRFIERFVIRLYREAGRNTRTVTFVGADPELIRLFEKMQKDPTLGYNVLGYYSDDELGTYTHSFERKRKPKPVDETADANAAQENPDDEEPEADIIPIKKLGTMEDFLNGLNNPEDLVLGDDLYLCISRRDKKTIKKVSQMCDRCVIRFYYVPVSVESIGLNLKREFLDDIEVFTTYENPLQSAFNRGVKRFFDILLSILFLIPTAILFPIIFIFIKIQSPGPILFKQKRTGLDGREFEMLKFRSMHVNNEADTVQATKDDPRKFPFGNFMRRFNIDELPQFINVLKGDMSIVGPRPHMLAHTEMYSSLIDKYMVRHFVKPGITGWAQVTGFRGETKELWQMEGRVRRDIWYMEHWNLWLDLRILWLTVKRTFKHNEEAY